MHPYSEPMVDDQEFRRWRSSAEDAADAARTLASTAPHSACFLFEQAAQLAVKGLLHGVGTGAWGNDLVALGERLAEALGDPLPADVHAALARLSRFYIGTRYADALPGGSPASHFVPDDARSAESDLLAVVRHVDVTWKSLEKA